MDNLVWLGFSLPYHEMNLSLVLAVLLFSTVFIIASLGILYWLPKQETIEQHEISHQTLQKLLEVTLSDKDP